MANLFAESMYAQCKVDGNLTCCLRPYLTAQEEDRLIFVNGMPHHLITTAGLTLVVKWTSIPNTPSLATLAMLQHLHGEC